MPDFRAKSKPITLLFDCNRDPPEIPYFREKSKPIALHFG